MSGVGKEWILERYRTVLTIRRFEDKVHELFAQGEFPGLVHLAAGQEACAVGVVGNLRRTDHVYSTHRNHGHAIAKGVEPKEILAEIYGRRDGSNRGMGGSMQIANEELGFMSGGIVGGAAPVALGPAMNAMLNGTDGVSVCYLSDGGAQQGAVLESMNLAVVWKLPVIFACEDNGFAQATPVSYSAGADLAKRAAAFGMCSADVDGQRLSTVNEAAVEAIDRARAGDGPSFIRMETYPYYGAWEGEAKRSYRSREVERDFRSRDPLDDIDREIEQMGEEAVTARKRIEIEVRELIDEAVLFAQQGSYPAPDQCLTSVYVDELCRVDSDGLSVMV